MKYILGILLGTWALVSVPDFAAGARQAAGRGDAIQTANDNGRSQSDRSTSHDRHLRKHRVASHHHRRRTSGKGNTH